MASGVIELARNSTGVFLIGQIVWSSVSNGSEANTSKVTATLQLQRYALNTTTGTFKGTFTVGGASENISWYGSLPSKTWVTIKTITVTVNHNASGVGSCYMYAKINGPSQTTMEGTYVAGSSTVTLDTIPRQAVMTSAANFNDEENPKITYTNPLGGAAPSLQAGISLTQSSSGVIAYHDVDKTAGVDTVDLTESERNTIRAAVTGGNTRTVWIYLRTRIGETYYYSPASVTVTIKNPKPTISPTIVDSNSTTIALTGNSSKLVRYYSNATIAIGAAAVKGASLTSKKVTCGSKSLTADGTINAVESGSFVFTATDNRGNSTAKTVTPSFVNYVKLTCTLANNMPATDGSMTVKVTGNYYNGSFGSKSNSLNVYYRYKTAGGTYGSWATMTVTKSGNPYSATASLTGLDYQTNYVFQAYAVDALATVYSAEKNVKATPVFDWGENDFNFNVPVDMPALNFTEQTITVNGDLDTYYPVLISNTYADSVLATAKMLFLSKDLGSAHPSWSGNHSNGSSIKIGWLYRSGGWDGNGSYISTLYKDERYAKLISNIKLTEKTERGLVLWLRGGGATYQIASNTPITVNVYLSSTNICTSASYTETIAPRTDIGNGGVLFSGAPIDFYYPINSIYIGYSHTSPASLFGGTWQRIEGRILYGCASSGTIGATGTHTTGSGSSSLPYVNVAIWRRTA